MKRTKRVLNQILHPPVWVLSIVIPAVFAALIFIFTTDNTQSALAYPIYLMSACSLVVLTATVPQLTRRIRSAILDSKVMQKAVSIPLLGRYLTDAAFRGSISIYQGMVINFLYMIFRVYVGVRYASVWFISMAAYYLVLGGLRAYLIHCYRRRDQMSEFFCYRRTAWLLFVLNIPMGGMILLMVQTNSDFTYPDYIIYLSALYTFYTISLSIFNLFKFHKIGSPVLSAAKVLNFISAMMSILGLQTAMITRFSEHGEDYRILMNAIPGRCVYAMVIAIAIYMLHGKKDRTKGRRKFVNRSESKYFRTAAKIDEVFMELLEKKELSYISVKELCEKAGVNRSTFYLHYDNMADLLAESLEYINGQFLNYYAPDSSEIAKRLHCCPQDELYLVTPEYLTPYLTYIKDHKRIFRTALENATVLQLGDIYNKMFQHIFIPILKRYHVPDQDMHYIMAFHIRGLIAIVTEWVENNCTDSIEHIITIIQQCVAQPNTEYRP